MSATKLTNFIKFHTKYQRLSGFQFFTYQIEKNGEISSKFKLFDVILLLLSLGFSFYFLFFDRIEVKLSSLVNSTLIQALVEDYMYTFGIY